MNPEITLVETLDEAIAFRSWLGERRPILAIDTETTGLEWWTPRFLRTVQFGDGAHAWVLPADWWWPVIRDAVRQYAGPVVMHNAKFDMHALRSAGIIAPPGVHDTKLMAWLLDPPGRHSLKPLADRFVDPTASKGQSLLKRGMARNHWTWATVPLTFEPYWTYAGLDTSLTALLAEKLLPQIAPYQAAYDQERQVQEICTDAEARGVRLDQAYTEKLLEEWAGEMQMLEARLGGYGIENPRANAQISAALKTWEAWDPEEWTATGQPRLDEGVLKGIPGEIAPAVLEYRRLRKWASAYLQNFLDQQDADGYVHCTINTLRARTGRMSVTNPALQTLPRGAVIRDCFIPRPGRQMLAVDYSQIELRLLAHFAQEQPMIDAFLAGKDLHQDTADRIYGGTASKAQRSIAKNGNFAKVYGAGAAKFASTTGIPVDEATEFMRVYDATYPGVNAFMRQVERLARCREAEEGAAYVMAGGRRLPADQDKAYTLVNFLIQGTAAVVLKRAIHDLAVAGLDRYLLLPIHDELLFDVPADEMDDFRPEVESVMQDLTTYSVPLTVESGVGTTWGACK